MWRKEPSMTEALEDRDLQVPDHGPGSGNRIEPAGRRVRAVFAGTTVADSTDVLVLLEARHLPVYYFPVADVRLDLLEPTDTSTQCPYKGKAVYWTARVGHTVVEDAVWS